MIMIPRCWVGKRDSTNRFKWYLYLLNMKSLILTHDNHETFLNKRNKYLFRVCILLDRFAAYRLQQSIWTLFFCTERKKGKRTFVSNLTWFYGGADETRSVVRRLSINFSGGLLVMAKDRLPNLISWEHPRKHSTIPEIYGP